MPALPLVVITGPTASGKTRRAVDVARALDAEIISADSRQVYTGMDLGTGKEQNITITSSTNMSKEDIDKAVKEAQQFAAEDAKKKEEVDIRNQGEQMVYQTEKTLEDLKDKLDANDKATLDAALNKLKEALKGSDSAAIKAATEELGKAFYPITEKLYQQANPQGGQPGPDMGAGFGGQAGPADDGVVDADYTVIDDNDNK